MWPKATRRKKEELKWQRELPQNNALVFHNTCQKWQTVGQAFQIRWRKGKKMSRDVSVQPWIVSHPKTLISIFEINQNRGLCSKQNAFWALEANSRNHLKNQVDVCTEWQKWERQQHIMRVGLKRYKHLGPIWLGLPQSSIILLWYPVTGALSLPTTQIKSNVVSIKLHNSETVRSGQVKGDTQKI